MGIFGKSKANILAEAFYKSGLFGNKLDQLCAAEAGASMKDVLRESDFSVWSKGANDKKEISDLDSFPFNYLCYLPGRLVKISEIIDGNDIQKLFNSDELKDIDEKNAVKALDSKWKEFVKNPDIIFPGYSPSIIYYKKIDICRIMEHDGKNQIQLRVGDFNYFLSPFVSKGNQIKGTRNTLTDRDDMRFLNMQIAESNLK